MWIKRIELTNFQKHEKFSADFVKGVNSIIGETDKGKSCVVRAMRWVLFNEPKGDIVRKFGTKLTTVALFLDTGEKVTRAKGDSVNAYEVHVPGKEPVRFDSVGLNIPEEVRRVLNADLMCVDNKNICLNMSSQLEAPFMLSETGGFRMKVLNKLVGSDILDLVSQDLNKDILRIGRDEKAVVEALDRAKAQLSEVIADKLLKEKKLSDVRAVYEGLEAVRVRQEGVARLDNNIRDTSEQIKNVTDAMTEVVIPEGLPQLKELASRFNNTRIVKISFDVVIKRLVEVEAQIGTMVIPEGIDESIKLSARVNDIKKLVERAVTVDADISGVQPLVEASLNEIEGLRATYKALLKQYGKCPVCHTPVTEEVLGGIEL